MKKNISIAVLALFAILPSFLPAQVFTIPYSEDFESGAPGWVAQGNNNSQWELGVPNYGLTNSTHSGNFCWDVDLNSGYTNSANCYLRTPVFNFSNNISVKISFWQNFNCEGYWDGTVLEYTYDTLQNWNVLGGWGSPGTVNWYSDSSINATQLPGWTGNSNGWIQSSIVLPNIFGNNNVWFRFRFASDASVTLDGYSIDDFRIDESEANVITGTVYHDLNSNYIFDAGDLPLPGVTVTSLSGGATEMTPSDQNGNYYFIADSANIFDISLISPLYSTFDPPTGYSITFNGSNQIDSANHFLVTFIDNVIDVGINMFQGGVRPGINTHTNLNYYNQGTTVTSGTITLQYDTAFSLVSASQGYAVVGPNTIEFTYSNLLPGQSGNISCIFLPSLSLTLGTITHLNTVIFPVIGDTLTINNYDSVHPVTVNSCDPNDISVEPAGDIYIQQVASGIDLNYTIRFQNTGTAPALSVHVYDQLSSNLNLGSFEITGSSHPITSWSINANRLLHFEFENINLQDSVSNEPASHGYIGYRIRPLTSLQAGDEIDNQAAIYFDNNAAVLTNIVNTKVILPTGLIELNSNESLVVFPNPASDNLFFRTEPTFKNYELFNNLGQKVISGIVNSQHGLHSISLSKLSKGVYILVVTGENFRRNAKVLID